MNWVFPFLGTQLKKKIPSLLSRERLKALNWEIKGRLGSGAPVITPSVICTNLGVGKCPLDTAQTPCADTLHQINSLPVRKQRDPRLFPSFLVVWLEFILVSSGCPHARHRAQIQAGEINLMEGFVTKHTRIRQPHQLQVWSANKPVPGCLKSNKWLSNIEKKLKTLLIKPEILSSAPTKQE